MQTHKQHNRSAFTLVELLVVIAIILILIALLLPALEGMQRRVDTVVCMNNLRQLTMGMNLYQADYCGEWPTDTAWVRGGNCYPTCSYWADVGNVTNGLLFPYVRNAKLYVCPTFRKVFQAAPWYAAMTPACTYSLSIYVGIPSHITFNKTQGSLSRWQLADSSIAVLGDEGPFYPLYDRTTGAQINQCPINNNSMGPGGYAPGDTSFVDTLASFHNYPDPLKGFGNVAFADGHVEIVDPARTKELFTPPCYKKSPYRYPCQ